jgi:cysteine synthase A
MIAHLIGNTPLYPLEDFSQLMGLQTPLLAKLERANPAGSIKDRPALYMLRAAVEQGRLAPGGTVIEPTSGNTGIALAALGKALGYRIVIVMPDSMSIERQKLIRAYGAELVLTPGSGGMTAAIAMAESLAANTPNSLVLQQFENPANALAHYETTGPELWQQSGGALDALVAGVGTGGTITGAGRYLKEQNPAITLVAVEPAASPLLSGGQPAAHPLQGIGPNFVPGVLDVPLLDRILPVTGEAAIAACKALLDTEGLFMGISSGAALSAAVQLAQEPHFAPKRIAVILPDGGEKYMSSLD